VVSAADKDPRLVEVIRSKYTAARPLTDVIILRRHADGAFPLSEEEFAQVEALREADAAPTAINVRARTEQLRGKFGRRAQQLVRQFIDPTVNPALFSRVIAGLQQRAKQRAGVAVPVTSIDDPDMLERLLVALDEEFAAIAELIRAPAA
jgi:hypothetical protein